MDSVTEHLGGKLYICPDIVQGILFYTPVFLFEMDNGQSTKWKGHNVFYGKTDPQPDSLP